jgi:hypothetical protein
MGEQLQPRTVHGGAFIPTTPRSGNQGDTIFRVESMALRGRDDHQYWEVIASERDLDEDSPLVALTGTIDLVANDPTILGTGTLFLSELHIGQFVVVVDAAPTQVLVVKRIVSDTEYEAWRAPSASLSAQTGYRMSILDTVNQDHYTMLWGSLVRLDKGSLLSAGNGVVRINGSAVPGMSLSATPEPQISIYDSATGNFSNYTMGMNEPTAPTLAAVGGGTKGMQGGNYSLVITPNRTATQGYNNPSLRADVTIATGDMIAITFPAMDLVNGQDSWGVWVTTFADTLGADLNYLNGPWHFYVIVDSTQVSSAGGTFNIEYYDAEVEANEIVSFNNDPPPQASGIELLNFTPVWWGGRGPSYTRGATTTVDPAPGPFIMPAKPNNIEAAPADIQFASSPPETLIGAVSAQGRIYLLTPNHLEIAQATPDQRVPIIIRPFWKDGFSNPYQLVFVNGNLYGFTLAGPTRSVGDGDEIEAEKAWAGDVSEITDPWAMLTAGHVLVGYSPSKDAICFFHAADELNTDGFWTTKMLMYGLPQQQWIGARTISRSAADSIVSGVTTVGEKMLLTMGGRVAAP